MFFFFKQKTAYEMRISDWSSDVCSSDLVLLLRFFLEAERLAQAPGIDLLQRPFRQLAESEGAIGDANKAVHREAEMAADLAHLPVLAFVQGHGEPGIGAGLVVERGLDRAIVDALEDRKSTRLNSS